MHKETVSEGTHRTVRERACVLYDKATGAIRHIQHVIVMEGGHEPDEHQIEAMCHTALTKRGHSHEGLEALHLDRDALQFQKAYRVDPARRVLVEVATTPGTTSK